MNLNQILYRMSCVVLVLVITASNIVAQDNRIDSDANLIYVKIYSDKSREFLQLSDTSKATFRVDATQCSAISPSGDLIALSSYAKAKLEVIRLGVQKPLFESSWLPEWQACDFTWYTNDELLFKTVDNGLQRLSLSTGEIIAVNNDGPIATPILPYEAINAPKIWSLDRHYVVYNQCLDGKVDERAENCQGQSQTVVYDALNKSEVAALSDLNPVALGAAASEIGIGVPNPPSVFWSPSGKYLLYVSTEIKNGLKLYDLQLKTASNIALPETVNFISLFSAVQWSIDERSIGLWVFDGGDTGIDIPRRFMIWNSDYKSLQITANSFRVKQWVWSPSLQSIALVTNENELVELDLQTSKGTLIDTNVYAIVSWML